MRIERAALAALLALSLAPEGVSSAAALAFHGSTPRGVGARGPSSASPSPLPSWPPSCLSSSRSWGSALFVSDAAAAAAAGTSEASAPAEGGSVLPPSIRTFAVGEDGRRRFPRRRHPRRRRRGEDDGAEEGEAAPPPKLSEILERGTNRQSLAEIIRAGQRRERQALVAAAAEAAAEKEAAREEEERRRLRERKERAKAAKDRNGRGERPRPALKDDEGAEEKVRGEPWRASFASAASVQSRLSLSSRQNGSALSRSVRVLRSLLDRTPPEWCNESNVVHALTLSAKLAGGARGDRATREKRDELRGLVRRTLEVLADLVEDGRLSARQLCNAAWAAGKHCRADRELLPREGSSLEASMVATASMSARGVPEKWDLSDGVLPPISGPASALDADEEEDENAVVTRAMESIAARLIEAMELSHSGEPAAAAAAADNQKRRKRAAVKPGELSMAVWAYAVVRPRAVPPGWELPPRVGVLDAAADGGAPVPGAAATEEGIGGGTEVFDDVMTFEVRDDLSSSDESHSSLVVEDDDDEDEDALSDEEWEPHLWSTDECSPDVVDCLYDAVAAELIRQADAHSSPHTALHPATLNPVAEGTLLSKCEWRDLANIAWSYATRGHAGFSRSSERMMAALSEEVASRLDGDDVGRDFAGEEGDGKGEDRGRKSEGAFLPRDLSQIAWSLGVLQSDNFRLGDGLVRVMEAISRKMVTLSDEGAPSLAGNGNVGPSDLVQLAAALSHGRIDDANLLRAVYGEALSILNEEESRAFKRGKRGGEAAKKRGGQGTRSFRAWELSILLWVQARLYLTEKQGEVYRDFTAAAVRALMGRLRRAGLDGNTGGGGGGGGDNAAATSPDETRRIVERVGLGSQERANVAWSLAVLEGYDVAPAEATELLRAVFRASAAAHCSSPSGSGGEGAQPPRPIRLEHAHQLWQSLSLLETDCPAAVGGGEGDRVGPVVPPAFRSFLERTWRSEKSRRKVSSARHRALSQTLDLMGVDHRNEHEEDIDVAIVLSGGGEWIAGAGAWAGASSSAGRNGAGGSARGGQKEHEEGPAHRRRVAVEFDGPNHFTRETAPPRGPPGGDDGRPRKPPRPPRALGHTVLKYRLLKRQGWTVVRVPYFEFDKIPFWASMERQRYLQRLLKTHADIRFSDVDVSEYKPIVPNRKTRFD